MHEIYHLHCIIILSNTKKNEGTFCSENQIVKLGPLILSIVFSKRSPLDRDMQYLHAVHTMEVHLYFGTNSV